MRNAQKSGGFRRAEDEGVLLAAPKRLLVGVQRPEFTARRPPQFQEDRIVRGRHPMVSDLQSRVDANDWRRDGAHQSDEFLLDRRRDSTGPRRQASARPTVKPTAGREKGLPAALCGAPVSAKIRSPFDLTANLHAYVPRKATEGCLVSMVRALRAGVCRIALTGPTGHGKTLVLQMIADHVGHELGFVYLSYGALPPADLCTWALGRMQVPTGDDAIETLVTLARDLKENGKALLLLIDDANTLPLETAHWLSMISQELEGGIRIVVAATDGPGVEPVLEALGPGVERFRLEQPMTLDETHQYIKNRLENSDAPESTFALFDDATLRAIHRSSKGVARQIHQLASAALRGLPSDRIDCVPAEVMAAIEVEPAPETKPKPKPKPRRKKEKGARATPAKPRQKTAPKKRRATSKKPRSEVSLPPRAPDPGPRRSVIYARRAARDTELVPLDEVILSPQPETLKRPLSVAMAAPTRMRVFRSSLIVAAALVSVVLARPAAEFGAADIAGAGATASGLSRSTPGPPQPQPLEAPRHRGMDVTSVTRPVVPPTLGNLRETLVAAEAESEAYRPAASAPRTGQLTPSRNRPLSDWLTRSGGRDPGTPPAAPGP